MRSTLIRTVSTYLSTLSTTRHIQSNSFFKVFVVVKAAQAGCASGLLVSLSDINDWNLRSAEQGHTPEQKMVVVAGQETHILAFLIGFI